MDHGYLSIAQARSVFVLATYRSDLAPFNAISPVDEAIRPAAYRRLDILTKPRGVCHSKHAGRPDCSTSGYRVRRGSWCRESWRERVSARSNRADGRVSLKAPVGVPPLSRWPSLRLPSSRFQPPPHRTQRAIFSHYALLPASCQGLCDLSD